jgi:high-affinity nickel permease
MPNLPIGTFDDRSADLRGRLVGIYTLLIVANIAVWAWTLLTFRNHPVLLGTALLAYTPSMLTISPPSTMSRAS